MLVASLHDSEGKRLAGDVGRVTAKLVDNRGFALNDLQDREDVQ